MHDKRLSTKLYFKILKDLRCHICNPQIWNTKFSSNRFILCTYKMCL